MFTLLYIYARVLHQSHEILPMPTVADLQNNKNLINEFVLGSLNYFPNQLRPFSH